MKQNDELCRKSGRGHDLTTKLELNHRTVKKEEMTPKATVEEIRLQGGLSPPTPIRCTSTKTAVPTYDDLPEQGNKPVHGENAKELGEPLHCESDYQCIASKAHNENSVR